MDGQTYNHIISSECLMASRAGNTALRAFPATLTWKPGQMWRSIIKLARVALMKALGGCFPPPGSTIAPILKLIRVRPLSST